MVLTPEMQAQLDAILATQGAANRGAVLKQELKDETGYDIGVFVEDPRKARVNLGNAVKFLQDHRTGVYLKDHQKSMRRLTFWLTFAAIATTVATVVNIGIQIWSKYL